MLKRLEILEDEQRRLERECAREGGFLTSDPRCFRLLDVGRELDEIYDRLYEQELESFST